MARDSCVCCPYPLVAIPGLLSFITFILTWIAAISCNFYSITYSGTQDVLVGLLTVESIEPDYGEPYWDGSYCTGWNEANLLTHEDLDAAMKTARAFGIISGVLGTVALIMILVPSCVVFDDNRNQYLLILCGLCIFTGIATLLDLVALASDLCTDASECTLRTAGILSIVAGILWFVIACLMFFALKNPRTLRQAEEYFVGTPPVEAMPEQPPTEQKEVKTVQNADGSATTTTITTVVNADGSKTVTQTTEMIPAEADA